MLTPCEHACEAQAWHPRFLRVRLVGSGDRIVRAEEVAGLAAGVKVATSQRPNRVIAAYLGVDIEPRARTPIVLGRVPCMHNLASSPSGQLRELD